MTKKFTLSLLIILSINFFAQDLHINQIGFTPKGYKTATVKNLPNGVNTFIILDTKTGKTVFNGKIPQSQNWIYSNENLSVIDFSTLQKEGQYSIMIGNKAFRPFTISKNCYQEITKASCRAFYLNRASMDLETKYAGEYARKGGHPDNVVYIHSSAADNLRPENTIISSPGGWYDAGDYNKYIVNSGITVFTMLQAYENYSKYYQKLSLNIPESDNTLPDLLDEIEYNINWMLTMQDPNDGGVYHKLTEKKFSNFVKPTEVTALRYVVMKSTAATLDFAAILAHYARITKDLNKKAMLIEKAEKAYAWAEKNPNILYRQPEDIHTGTYANDDIVDEWFWAKAELFITSQKEKYNTLGDDFKINGEANWTYVKPLALFSLAKNKTIYQEKAQQELLKIADQFSESKKSSANGTVMGIQKDNFVWGSNSNAANQAILLIECYNFSKNKNYQDAAWSNIHYILGQNPLNYCYVTGFGEKSPKHPHHRLSVSDGVDNPQPGHLVGGPNYVKQDLNEGINYQSDLAALCYTDEEPSYASNEIAINWNATLVYVMSFVSNSK
jgi:endoglucanase